MMITDNRKSKWFFCPGWVVLSAISIPIAWIIYWALISLIKKVVGDTIQVGGQPHITEDFLLLYILAPAIGLVTGIFQYLLLRNAIEGCLAIGLGLLTTLTAGAIVRLGDFPIGLRLALGVNLINGLSLAYVGEYQASDLPPGIPHTPTFSNFAAVLTLYLVLTFGLIGGPLLLSRLWYSAMNRVRPSE